jgi:hypothetical protein
MEEVALRVTAPQGRNIVHDLEAQPVPHIIVFICRGCVELRDHARCVSCAGILGLLWGRHCRDYALGARILGF